MNLHKIGIDLGKTSFHLVGLSERGEVVVRKRFTRTQLLRFTANQSKSSSWSKKEVSQSGCRGPWSRFPVRE